MSAQPPDVAVREAFRAAFEDPFAPSPGEDWHAFSIGYHSHDPCSLGVLRIRSGANSVIAKHLRRDASCPGAEREVSAYQSGPAGWLQGALRAPRFLGTWGSSTREVWLWLEDLAPEFRRDLDVHDIEALSELLGTAQALWSVERESSRRGDDDDLERWVAEPRTKPPDAHCTAPATEARDLEEQWREVWHNRQPLLNIAREGTGKQSFCHYDFWHGNVVCPTPAGAPAYGLVDWSLTGQGPLGADLPFFALAAVWDGLEAADNLAGIEHNLLAGYARGVAAAGVEIEFSALRRRFAAVAALRYGLLAGTLIRTSLDDPWLVRVALRRGTTASDIYARRARLIHQAGEWLPHALGSTR